MLFSGRPLKSIQGHLQSMRWSNAHFRFLIEKPTFLEVRQLSCFCKGLSDTCQCNAVAASSVWQVSDKPQGRKARAVLAGRYSLGTLWGFDGLVRSLRCRRELSEVIILLVVTVRGHTFDLCGPLIVDGLEPMMPWRLMVGKGSPLPTETGRFIGLLFMRIFSGLRMTGEPWGHIRARESR